MEVLRFVVMGGIFIAMVCAFYMLFELIIAYLKRN